MAEQSLKDKTVKGTFWSAADAFLGQGTTFLIGIVLARILSPSEYGLIGIVLIFTTILTTFIDGGFSAALIRKKEVTDGDYNTMFIVNMFMSVLMYIILFFNAPLISNFFSIEDLTVLLRVSGCILVIQALSITQITILTKKIDFKTKAKASFISAVISGVIGVVMAYTGFGVWALVGQQLSRQAAYTLILWIFNRWIPDFTFNKDSFHYMWGYGWKLLISALINNVWNQLYQVVVGKFYNAETLGQYTRSREYANLFSQNFTQIVQRVTFPVLAEVQDEKERMVAAYRNIIKLSMFVAAISMIFLGTVSEPLIYCLIGPQWGLAASYLPLICISMSLYPLQAINLDMLQVQGRSDIFLYLEIIKKAISLLPICLGIFVSIYLMLISSIFTGIICFFLNSYYTGHNLGYSSWDQLKDIAPSYIIAFMIALPVYFLKYLPCSTFLILPLQLFVFILLLVLICEQRKMREWTEIKSICSQGISKIETVFNK